MRGKRVERLVLSRQVLWYRVCPKRLVQLVIVRDADGHEPDDFFFTTELDAAPEAVAGFYAGRWSIEDTFAQHQTVPRRPGPPNLDRRRTRASRRAVAVAVDCGMRRRGADQGRDRLDDPILSHPPAPLTLRHTLQHLMHSRSIKISPLSTG
ncbi:MAG: hypothetical protein ACRDZO_11025 [Egibacteraceae bacterium]